MKQLSKALSDMFTPGKGQTGKPAAKKAGKGKSANTTVAKAKKLDKAAKPFNEAMATLDAGGTLEPTTPVNKEALALQAKEAKLAQIENVPATKTLEAEAGESAPLQDHVAAVFRNNSYTCIRLSVDRKYTTFISMEALDVKRMENREFADTWTHYPTYPVRRAAELYLGNETYREVSPKARGHLEAIVRDPSTVYNPDRIIPQLKEETMQTETIPTKNKAAKTPLPIPTKKVAAKKANGIDTVVKGAKPAAKTAVPAKKAVAAKKVPQARQPDDTQYKVADDVSIKRGDVRTFVDIAKGLKKFKRDDLVAATVKAAKTFTNAMDEARAQRYFYYCTGHGVFAA